MLKRLKMFRKSRLYRLQIGLMIKQQRQLVLQSIFHLEIKIKLLERSLKLKLWHNRKYSNHKWLEKLVVVKIIFLNPKLTYHHLYRSTAQKPFHLITTLPKLNKPSTQVNKNIHKPHLLQYLLSFHH